MRRRRYGIGWARKRHLLVEQRALTPTERHLIAVVLKVDLVGHFVLALRSLIDTLRRRSAGAS